MFDLCEAICKVIIQKPKALVKPKIKPEVSFMNCKLEIKIQEVAIAIVEKRLDGNKKK